jgi:hypothetical protein
MRRVYSEYAASAARTTTAGGTAITGISLFTEVVFQVNVTAQSGTTPTLDLYIQTSYDGGLNWVDIAAATQITTVTGITILSHNPDGGTASPSFIATDGTKTGGTNKVVGWGDRLRLKWKIGGTTPSYTFSASASVQD